MPSPPLAPPCQGGESDSDLILTACQGEPLRCVDTNPRLTARRLVIDGRRLTARRTGVGRYLETLLNRWSETGWPGGEVVLAVQDASVIERMPALKSITIKVIGPNWPGLAWEMIGLRPLLRPGDLLFAPTNLIPPNWRGETVLVLFDTLLETCPEGFSRLTRWRFRGRYRSAAQRASRIIVPSYATRDDVARFYRIEQQRIDVIYPAIEPHFRPIYSESIQQVRQAAGLDQSPFFLFVGKPSARRHVPEILEAFTRHRTLDSTYRLVFVGPGSEEIPAQEGVLRLGHVSEETLIGLFNGALACLYPSDFEGFGLPVAEAMACGCPVVTLRKNALIESGGEAAFYLKEPSAAELFRAMSNFSRDPTLRQKHLELGLIHARKFQGDGFADSVKAVIERQLGLAGTQSAGVL